DGQSVTQGWGGEWRTGATPSVSGASWNSSLGSGGSVSLGFIASWNGANGAARDFRFNGVACSGSGATSSSTTTTTAPRTTTTTTTTTMPRTTSTTTTTSGGTRNTFTNPIKRNGPDPWLQYHNGYYYLATTTWNSTITMRRSRTLGGLAGAPDTVVFNLAGRSNGCCNMWAPEFHLLDGPNGRRWYLYYVAGQNVSDYNPTQRLHVLESAGTDPMGPYTFKADLTTSWELDASILQVGGRLYLLGSASSGTQSLSITPLANPWTPSGSRRFISYPTYAWERQTAPVNEGAEPLYHNGRTMIVFSASACWGPDYKLGLLTLTGSDPLSSGSWTKTPTPVFQRSDANSVYAPGHNGFFTSPDGTEDWIVYHANDSVHGGCDMNRSTRAQRFTWNADGTPDFGTPARLGVRLDAPSGEPVG
ncbi:MAG: family 43 glycosylhydrolase, partial [Actinomycetales bacterium]|nr:family 43 glycosylhydrolase [Actinomycetales bacterium]